MPRSISRIQEFMDVKVQVNFNPGGKGYLVYLVDGDVPFFRVTFSPILF